MDASRARLFTYERSSEADRLEEHLVEERDLVNPGRRLRHGADSVEAADAEFSRAVVDEVAALLRLAHAKRLILCASPHMLGQLRHAGAKLSQQGVEMFELARDLVKLTPAELREYLDAQQMLTARGGNPSRVFAAQSPRMPR